jgi:endonuclease III
MIKAISEQLTDILNRYRNMNLDDEKQREDLSKMIGISNIPSYHKEILITVLLSKTESEMVCSLEISRQREKIRHAEALATIESRALEERMRKNQRL